VRRVPWASFRSRLLQFRLELGWMSSALEDLTYVLHLLAQARPAEGRTFVFVDRTWMAAYCKACCAAFRLPAQVLVIDTRGTLEDVLSALPAPVTSTVVVSKILYLKYYSVLQDLKQRGKLTVA
jgi:hypothetical protein